MDEQGDLYFRQIPVGQMANFAYLVGSHSTREVLVVDPAWSVDELLDRAEGDGMKVVGALVTHYHQDHVGGRIFGFDIEGVARARPRLRHRAGQRHRRPPPGPRSPIRRFLPLS